MSKICLSIPSKQVYKTFLADIYLSVLIKYFACSTKKVSFYNRLLNYITLTAR